MVQLPCAAWLKRFDSILALQMGPGEGGFCRARVERMECGGPTNSSLHIRYNCHCLLRWPLATMYDKLFMHVCHWTAVYLQGFFVNVEGHTQQ